MMARWRGGGGGSRSRSTVVQGVCGAILVSSSSCHRLVHGRVRRLRLSVNLSVSLVKSSPPVGQSIKVIQSRLPYQYSVIGQVSPAPL